MNYMKLAFQNGQMATLDKKEEENLFCRGEHDFFKYFWKNKNFDFENTNFPFMDLIKFKVRTRFWIERMKS